MKSLNPLKFFSTTLIVFSFILFSQLSMAQKNTEISKKEKDANYATHEVFREKVESQIVSSNDNPLTRIGDVTSAKKVDNDRIPLGQNNTLRHPEEGVYSHPQNDKAKELIEKRDAFTKHFDNLDGTMTQMKSDQPIHYLKDGRWLTYDDKVVLDGTQYSLSSTDHPITVNSLNSMSTFNLGQESELILKNNSEMFYLSSVGNKLDVKASNFSTSSIDNSSIIFENVYNSIDKQFTLKRGYLRYDYIINSSLDIPSEANYLSFSDNFELPQGWSVEQGDGNQGDIGWKGSLNIMNENGKIELTIGLPFIYDSGDKSTSSNQEFGEYVWIQNGRELELQLNVSIEWLSSSNRVYPLIIDPVITESDLSYISVNKSSYSSGCEKSMTIDAGGAEILGYYCYYEMVAYNGAWMSEQRSRVNGNGTLSGSGYGGTYQYTTGNYTDLNGIPFGPSVVTIQGYRTWGGTACDISYQLFSGWYTYMTTQAPPCSGTPNAGTATFSSVSACSGTTITTAMSGTDDGVGISFQWFGNGAPLIGQTSAALSHIPAGTTDYFLEVTCSNGGGQAVTDPQIVEVTTCYNCPTSGNTSQLTCGASIYDNGGPGGSGTDDDTGNYSDAVDGSITIYPDAPGSMVSISGSIDTESNYDIFYVYDGTSTSATELTGGLSGTGGGLSYTATNVDGALTLRLDTDGTVNRGGFDFTVSCVSTCSGTPATGTATASAADNCSGTATTVAVSGTEVNGGISYDWESSADGSTGWASLGGVYQSSISQSPTSTIYYRHKTTCSNSGVSSYSNVVSKTVETITAGSDVVQCNSGSMDVTASTNSGTVEWYTASSGGSAVATGNTYSPTVSSTTIYYAASSGCTGTRVPITATITGSPTSLSSSVDVSAICDGEEIALSANSTGTFSEKIVGDNSGSTTTFPFRTYYEDARTQWIIPAADLTSAGLVAGEISSLSLNVTTVNSQAMSNFAIKLLNTGYSYFTNTTQLTGATTVYSGTYTVSGTGWQTFDFSSNFTWDGTSSIMIEICYDNTTWGGYSYVSTETTAQTTALWTSADGNTGCSMTGGTRQYFRPWTKFNCEDAVTYAWTSDVGGFTSSDQNPTGVSPSQNTTYSVVASSPLGCTVSDNSTAVTVDYASPITTTVGGSAVSTGADMRLDQNVEWTYPGSGGTHTLGYKWDSDESTPFSNYSFVWTSTPQSWSDNEGNYLNGGTSRTLYVRSKFENNGITCFSDDAFSVILREPAVTTSVGSLSAFTNCEGTAATEQTFTVSGQYLTNPITVTAPTGYEVSKTSGSGYASNITFAVSAGSVTNENVYVRVASSTSSGTPSGNVVCTTTYGSTPVSISANVSATSTVTAIPSISSTTDGATCGTGTVALSASVSNGTINWYSASTGGTSLGSGTSYTTDPISSTTTYYVDGTDGSCVTAARTAVTATYNEDAVAGSLSVDLTEALSTETINWTNSGISNGTRNYWYQWTDNSGISPLPGQWVDFGVTTEANSWATSSAGSNMNRTLWVKTIITSDQSCADAETTPVYTDVKNCRAGTVGASVSEGTVANLPFGEIITYNAAMDDGAWERFQYQWNSTSGSWTNWGDANTNPYDYTANINAGQTLYVRSEITGVSVSGSPTCTDYSDPVQTFIIDCSGTVSADAGSDDELCNGNSVVITGSGSGNSAVTGYSWSPATELSSTTIANPTVSATSSRTYTLTTTHADGCTSTDDIVITVDDAPVITSSSTVTDVTTCGNTSIDVSVSANAGEGDWSNTGIGSFDASTGSSTTFQSNTFDTDMTLTWTQNSGGCSGSTATITARFNQPVTTSLNAYTFDTECWIWGGLTNTEWSEAANWYKYDGSKWLRQSSSTPGASDKVYLMSYTNAGSLCVSNSNNAIIPAAAVTDLIVGSGAEVDLNGSFSLAGNLTNNGTINYGTSSVSMTGDSDQTVSGSATTLNNLTVNKTGGSLIVSTPITVMGTLDMSAGNIVNSSIVILGSSSTDPGTLSHTTGIITGEFRRYFPNATGSQLFPIGTASIMRDVSVNFTSAPGTNQYLTASYVTGAPTLFGGGAYEGLPLVTENGQLITNYDNEGHWVINPTNDDYTSTINGKAYTISLHMNGIADATDYSKTRIIKSAGSNTASQHHLSWEALTSQSVSGYNGANPSNSNFAVTATSTGFSLFGGGSDNGDPLPVELVSFNGSCNDGLVELIWETASEYNSSHFDVENSRDGIIWDVVKTIEAAGNSNEMLTYKYTDVNAHGGNNYYRLTQVDIDGTSKTYDIINVSCSQTTAGYFSIFPNPSSGSFQVILNNSDIIGDAEMNIVDTKGNSVLMKSIDVKSGINMYVVDEELAPGIYYICVKNGDKTTIVLKHSVK